MITALLNLHLLTASSFLRRNKMKHFISLALYHIGDFASKRGWGWLYVQSMHWSVYFDVDEKVWKEE